MNIAVCIKQTPDSNSVYIDPISGQVDYERFVQVLNPADNCAVEAAVRLKKQFGGSVAAISLGSKEAEGALRAALALGADAAVRLWNEAAQAWQPLTVAAVLSGYMKSRGLPDLVFCGNASSDWSHGIVGPALAEQLNWPQITSVSRIEVVEAESSTMRLTRKLERGYREIVQAQLPILLTVTSDLNEPRYPSLPAHLAALKAVIPVIDPFEYDTTLEHDVSDETTIMEIHTPRPLPRRITAPDSRHSAFERIGEIVSGGATGKSTRLVEGSPQELARVLVEFLREKGFLRKPSNSS
jgi:electron transfer flavoprotein beta subunit